MKNKIFACIVLLFCISCSGQTEKEKDKNEKSLKMKKLDKEIFKKNWAKGGSFFSLSDGSKVQQYETEDGYDEIINRSAPSFISEYNTYYKDGNIKSSLVNFLGIPVEKSFEFDEKGNLIFEKNEDEKFGKIKYSDILKLMSNENILDLKTGKGWYLDNGNNAINAMFDEKSKEWKISVTSGKLVAGGKSGTALLFDKIFYIDGNSGKIINKTVN